jgi:octopine/nopaline transport system substrate-binding protein
MTVKLSDLRLKLAMAALALLSTLAAPAAQAKDWKKIVIATEGSYAPYNMRTPDGKLVGFEIDLANNLCDRLKITCEFVAQDWNGIIPGLTEGKYDAIMDGMSITPKRLDVIDFTAPYTASPSTFAVMKDSPLAKLPDTGKRVSLDDKAATDAAIADITPMLKGKVIGVQISTIQTDLLNTYLKGIATIRTYPTTEEHDLDLQAGRVDAVLASTSYFVSTLSKPGGDQMVLAGPRFVGGLLGQGTGIGLRKSDTDLKAMLNTALAAAKAEGTIKTLSVKWFKTDVSPP